MCNNKTIENSRDLGLYIHIPFCVKKCDYCDFLSATYSDEIKRDYFAALNKEIQSYEKIAQDYLVPTIFIGGGTPSCVDPSYILELMNTVRKVFPIDHKRLEVTIEINPGTITKDKLVTYGEAGINRLSFGLQSANNHELKLLGRIHSYEEFEENYHMARALGFSNINVDLMSALPGQTLSTWEDTLCKIVDLNPEHISAYSLIIEEGTKFYEKYGEGREGSKVLPDEDTDRLIYHRTKDLLKESGYYRYEISNYAKIGHECAHNISYWVGTEYLGMGLGASSLINGARITKMHDIKKYIQLCNSYNPAYEVRNNLDKDNATKEVFDPIGIVEDMEVQTMEDRMEEFMYLGLRMCKGISKSTFSQRFHRSIESVYGKKIEKFKAEKLLIEEGDFLRLSEYGIDISNSILYEFLLN